MTKICKASVEKPRKSPRTTKSPFKINEKETRSYHDPIILLTDPSSEPSEKEPCYEDNDSNSDSLSNPYDLEDSSLSDAYDLEDSSLNSAYDLEDFISAYYSDTEEENDKDPDGVASYLKLKGMIEQFLRDLNVEAYNEDDGSEGEYFIEFQAYMDEDSIEPDNANSADNGSHSDNLDNADNDIDTDNADNMHSYVRHRHINRNSLLDEVDFIVMIEGISEILIMKYILKVLDYVRKLQITTLNENIKKRIAAFFKYIDNMPDSEIRKDCEDLKKDLLELNGEEGLENFPQSGAILIDLIDGKNTGLSTEEISKLSTHKYSGPIQNKCCICLGDMEEGDDVIHLKTCSHEYHATCLVSWLKISNQCPICRNVVGQVINE